MWLWFAMLSWTFPSVSAMRWHTHFLYRLWVEHESQGADLEGLRATLVRGWSKFEWHFFPIWFKTPEAELGPWTLLVLRRPETFSGEAPEIFYFEGLSEPRQGCKERAQLVLNILGIDAARPQTNKWRQKGDECAALVMHYEEQVMRHAAGEGWGATRGLTSERHKSIRQALGKWMQNLEKARVKWIEDSAEEGAQIKKLHETLRKKLSLADETETELPSFII